MLIRLATFRSLIYCIANLYGLDLLKGKAFLHHILESDVILIIIGYIIRQRCGQSVRYSIADIIVSTILPVTGFSSAVIGIFDLLLEGGLANLLVSDSGNAILCFISSCIP